MKLTITKERRRFFLFLPLVVIPFCCLVFHVLGGGRGAVKAASAAGLGLNTQLPAVSVDIRKAFQDKLKTYEQAENDSLRKAQYERQDPYRKDSVAGLRRGLPVAKPVGAAGVADARASQFEAQLARLRQSLHPVSPIVRPAMGVSVRGDELPEERAPDPQLDRLNAMLDKVIRIQHPEERVAAAVSRLPVDEVGPADSTVNSITAAVSGDQRLSNGMTIALRLVDSVRVSGRVLPAGQMVYGTVSIGNDRLLVRIGSLRDGGNLYVTDWQVFDLDGLAGIHIPGLLGREVAKQSADQGVSGLNLMTVDPGLGAQAANAGIQAAKSFLGRKARQVRVDVRAGYIVLLRSTREREQAGHRPAPARVGIDSGLRAPTLLPGGGILERCRNEGVELRLKAILVRDGCVWFGLEWENRSPMGYRPGYTRWYVRDRRAFRRTAVQEVAREAVAASTFPGMVGDSACYSWTGFPAFAMAKGKELVLEVGEKGGGRNLELVISSRELLKATSYAKEKGGAEDGTADDPLY